MQIFESKFQLLILCLKLKESFNNEPKEKELNNRFDNKYCLSFINHLATFNYVNTLDGGISVEKPGNIFLAIKWLLKAIESSKTNNLVLATNISDGNIVLKKPNNIFKTILWLLAATESPDEFNRVLASDLRLDFLKLLVLSK